MKLKTIIFSACLLTAFCACKKFNNSFDSLLNNPSSPTPAAADVDLYLNNLELSLGTNDPTLATGNFFSGYDNVANIQGVSDFAAQLTRMQALVTGNTYFNAYTPGSFDNVWLTAYTNIFKTANTMIPLAEEKGQYIHAGIAKVMKAYTMITLVDVFGDVPYSEANQGVTIPNPKVDKGADVYAAALSLLDSAIDELGKPVSPTAKPTNDIFYNGDAPSWITLAKTIKLKAYLQTRLVDNTAASKISSLITENDLINSASQDFVFTFSSHSQAPDSRHPAYILNYGTDAGTTDYMGNYFMYMMVQEKGFVDPRTRYYLYRQCDNITNDPRLPDQTTLQFAIPCYFRAYPPNYPATSNPTNIGFTSTPYCIVDSGYWGRDHENNEGFGPDQLLRTTWGLYPVAGAFDANQNTGVGQSSGRVSGAKGNGIFPIWLSSFTYFAEAEAALTLGTPGDPQQLLAKAINASFDKVSNFATSIGYTLPTSDTSMTITPSNQQNYVNKVMTLYQNAASTDAKLNIIMKEYYLAAWGNGIEPYNGYRRTGKPDNMQPALTPSPGSFTRSFFYPAAYVNFNRNATQKAGTNVKVFWDNNPDDFVK
jgi:hypothetical protein